jgi:pimeloyl-ACP methyl ester carboxylesterase
MARAQTVEDLNQQKGMVRHFIFLVSTVFVVGLAASWIVAGDLVAPSPHVIGPPPKDLPILTISLASDSGSVVAGWHIPANGSTGVVVLIHGIRSSRLSMLERARLLHTEGYSILMIDLQAHGESPGNHITIGHLERHDVRAAVEFARNAHPNEPIGVLGISLGGASAILASPLGVSALVLESVYPHIDAAVHNRVAAKLGVFSVVPAELLLVQLEPRLGISTSQLRPIDNINNVKSPVFLISGTEDQYTTVDETQAMFHAAQKPKQLWLVDGAAHEDMYRASPVEYSTKVIAFFNRYLRRQEYDPS